jgi:hypothetical protein
MIPSHLSDLPHRTEQEQVTFFESVLALSRRACAGAQSIHKDVTIAGVRIRFVFAGPALNHALFGAISHREAPAEGSPDVTLYVWDSASTGVDMIPSPVKKHCFTERGDIWTMHSRRIRSAFLYSEYSLNLFDHQTNTGVCWFQSADGLPYWTQASPFRTLFHWIFSARDAQLIHAAAVATEDGAVLVTGRGGTGKSTTALSCAKAGLSYIGDDYVLLTGGDDVRVHSLYRTAKIEPSSIAQFEDFSPRILGEGAVAGPVKAVATLNGGFALSAPVRAALHPVFGEGPETRLEAVGLSQLLGAATLTTLAQLPHADQSTVDFIGRQLARVDCAKLSLGQDWSGIPPVLTALLKGPRGLHRAVPGVRDAGLISVIIPVYNAARFLDEGVRSILNQSYPKIEIIVVDDGSTDDLERVIQNLPVEVRFVRQPNRGPASARNAGIQRASGDLMAFLDADDLWPQGRMAGLLAALEDAPDCDVVIGDAQLMEQNALGGFDFVGNPEAGFKHYIGAAVYRRRAFEKNGLFDEKLRFGEDLDWFANVSTSRTVVQRVEAVTLYVRRHDSNMTRNKTGQEINSLQLVRNALHRKRIRSGTG